MRLADSISYCYSHSIQPGSRSSANNITPLVATFKQIQTKPKTLLSPDDSCGTSPQYLNSVESAGYPDDWQRSYQVHTSIISLGVCSCLYTTHYSLSLNHMPVIAQQYSTRIKNNYLNKYKSLY